MHFLIDVHDLELHVTTPKDTKIDLRKIRMLVFNYTGGELEAYIDNLQFRKDPPWRTIKSAASGVGHGGDRLPALHGRRCREGGRRGGQAPAR